MDLPMKPSQQLAEAVFTVLALARGPWAGFGDHALRITS